LDPAKFSPDDQIKVMRMKMKLQDRAYLWVDVMIIVMAVGCIVYFGWDFLKTRPSVARVGLAIMIGSVAFDIWRPIRARRKLPQPPADAPVAQWLRHELEKERARHELTHTMLLWELLPFWIGTMVFTWGLNFQLSFGIIFSAGFTGMSVSLYVGRWKLNQYTLRKASRLLKAELESLLKANMTE
jgi:hypothetical protein